VTDIKNFRIFFASDRLDIDMVGKSKKAGGKILTQATRVARVGAAAANIGIGAGIRAAGGKLSGQSQSTGRTANARAIRAALGGLKGPIVKVAQLLATVPNALPEEYVQELRQLQSHAPPMGWAFVRRRMSAELGPDWLMRFKDFDKMAVHAASLGQVHRAVALDGAVLACKLQYPDMQSVVAADLAQLKFIMGLYENFDKAVRTGAAYEEITARLYEELDYTREGRAMNLYSDILKREAAVHVPVWRDDLSSHKLLTMTWLEGHPLMDFVDADQTTRNAIAHHLFRAWYVPFYEYGMIHGDPHLGNYTVRLDHSINLLDFGCVRIFDASFVRGVIDLYHALQQNDAALAMAAYETWGFKNLSKSHVETLNLWARFLYGPLLEDRARPIGELDGTGIYGRDTAMQVHAALKKLGGVAIPQAFVFMDRAALGLGSVFLHLRATLNWHDMFHTLIADFDETALRDRQANILKHHKLAG
jgi:predicted unusual protein kinase regulating ubiquinone biosynthesis (AarF/ABC1/UbiB family)